MNLKNFESIVEPKIVDRGFHYYEYEQVTEIEQVEKGEFCATVFGTEEYNVFIKINGDLDIVDHRCDCPYDWGDVCKHEVAVFYYLKDSQLYEKQLEKGKIHTIKNDLTKLKKTELVTLITELVKRNKSFREEVMWELGYE